MLEKLSVMAIHCCVSREKVQGIFEAGSLHIGRRRAYHAYVWFVARPNSAKNRCFVPSAALFSNRQADSALLSGKQHFQWQCLGGTVLRMPGARKVL
jgi:hypothetical protein